MSIHSFFKYRTDLTLDKKISMIIKYVNNLEEQNDLLYNALSDIDANKKVVKVLERIYQIGLTNPVFEKMRCPLSDDLQRQIKAIERGSE